MPIPATRRRRPSAKSLLNMNFDLDSLSLGPMATTPVTSSAKSLARPQHIH